MNLIETLLPAVQPGRTKVVVVDADAVRLEQTRARLEFGGYEVTSVSSSEAALAAIARERPAAVVSDLQIGAGADLAGLALCRTLRSSPRTASVPVILMCAAAPDLVVRDLGIEAGAHAVMGWSQDLARELRALRSGVATPAKPVGPAQVEPRAIEEPPERKHASRYRTVFERADDAIALLRPDGTIVEVNLRWQELMGRTSEEAVGRRVEELTSPEHRAARMQHFETAVAEGVGRGPSVPVMRPDGSTVHLQFSAKLVDVDGEPLVISIGRDVSDQVQSGARLSSAEAQYRALVERIPEVLWTCNGQFDLVFITPNVQRVLGYRPEELLGQRLSERADAVHEDDRAMVAETIAAAVRDGTPFDLEYRYRKRDGGWIWVRNRSTGVFDRDGARVFEGTLADITERKQLEATLSQSQKMEGMGQLIGGVAHDFNNLLAAILGNSHFLLQDTVSDDPRRADAMEIRDSAARAAALTRQLLAFSRLQVLEPRVVDMRIVVAGIERMLRRLISEDVRLVVNVPEALGTVRVDVGQLEQVIVNMSVNARDAMPRGGTLTIETKDVELTDEPGMRPGRYVALIISDTGTGIDAETLLHIYEPFFTTKEVGKGTGLGLSTCYGIVQQSGGHIRVESEVGRGTTFRVYFPRLDEPPEDIRRAVRTGTAGGNETILIVEDDDQLRAVVRRTLAPKGYRLLVASDGLDAIRALEAHPGPLDMVLTDVIMPGMSGPELVERISPGRPHLAVLYMSGYLDHATLRIDMSRVALIRKPFLPEGLLAKVREVLDGRSPGSFRSWPAF